MQIAALLVALTIAAMPILAFIAFCRSLCRFMNAKISVQRFMPLAFSFGAIGLGYAAIILVPLPQYIPGGLFSYESWVCSIVPTSMLSALLLTIFGLSNCQRKLQVAGCGNHSTEPSRLAADTVDLALLQKAKGSWASSFVCTLFFLLVGWGIREVMASLVGGGFGS